VPEVSTPEQLEPETNPAAAGVGQRADGKTEAQTSRPTELETGDIGAGGKRLADGNAEFQIDVRLEKALFIRFWTWLAVVSLFAVPVVTGIAVLAVQGVQLIAGKRIDDLLDRIKDVEKSSLDSFKTMSANNAVTQRLAAESASLLDTLKGNLRVANVDTLIANVQNATQSPQFIAAVSDQIAKNYRFTATVIGPSGPLQSGAPQGMVPNASWGVRDTGSIPEGDKFAFCAISGLLITPPTDGNPAVCELYRTDLPGWRIKVTAAARCQVTCFRLEAAK
jgi:hypothetical protein